MTEMERHAIQIASHIRNGDGNVASALFQQRIDKLNHFEAVRLKDMVHESLDKHRNGVSFEAQINEAGHERS